MVGLPAPVGVRLILLVGVDDLLAAPALPPAAEAALDVADHVHVPPRGGERELVWLALGERHHAIGDVAPHPPFAERPRDVHEPRRADAGERELFDVGRPPHVAQPPPLRRSVRPVQWAEQAEAEGREPDGGSVVAAEGPARDPGDGLLGEGEEVASEEEPAPVRPRAARRIGARGRTDARQGAPVVRGEVRGRGRERRAARGRFRAQGGASLLVGRLRPPDPRASEEHQIST